MRNKGKIFLLTLVIVSCFGVVSFAKQPLITAKNNTFMTKQKHYPVINMTNHSENHIMVEWIAYEDSYKGDILVPPNTTISLHLPQLSFLGENQDTTNVWLTWADENFLKLRGIDIITTTFDSPKAPSDNPPT